MPARRWMRGPRKGMDRSRTRSLARTTYSRANRCSRLPRCPGVKRSAPSTDGNGAVKRRTFSPPGSLLPRPIVPMKPAGRPRSAAVQSCAEDLPARTAALRPPRSAPWPLRAAALGAAAPPQRDTEFTPRIQPEATPIGDEQRPTGQPWCPRRPSALRETRNFAASEGFSQKTRQ